MKLAEIRSAIRKMKGNPSITVELTPGVPMTLILQKTPTLETLGLAYDGVTGDIGLTISNDGVISGGDHTPVAGVAVQAFDLEEDDML